MKNLTIKEIARIANVSPMTVSRVINNERYVKKETKDKIIKLIKKFGYEPNYFAKSLRTNKSKTIGLIIGDIENPFFARLSKGAISLCETYNYNVIVCNSEYDPNLGEKYINMLLHKGIDGLLICTLNLTEESINKIKLKNIPFVLITCNIQTDDVNYIISDAYHGGTLVIKYLIELGHKKIYFLRPPDVYTANERLRAFKDTLLKFNLNFNSEQVSKPLLTEEEVYKETIKFLENRNDYTAIIAGNDFIALTAMKAIMDKNLKIPDDISIIGYDNLNFTPLLKIPLTTIRTPKLKFGQLAAKRLIEIITNPESNKKTQIINIKPELVIRESCKRIN